MKLLLIAASNVVFNEVSPLISAAGWDIIRYRDLLKAADNLPELNPDAIMFAAPDFPRHWKLFFEYSCTLRGSGIPANAPEALPFILLYDASLPAKDRTAARYLGVGGISLDWLREHDGTNMVSRLLNPYGSGRREHWMAGRSGAWKMGCVFTNPRSGATVAGRIHSFDREGFVFQAVHPRLCRNLRENVVVGGCSLRAGHSVLHPVCRVSGIEGEPPRLHMKFISFPQEEEYIMKSFLAGEGQC
jgi:hypothetical protein